MKPAHGPDVTRRLRGRRSDAAGRQAETLACAALERDGWTILVRRCRTPAGEIDAVAECRGLLAIVEIKSRPTLIEAAVSLGPRQRSRLLAAAAFLLGEHPDWGRAGVRFDLLLVDMQGTVRRIIDVVRSDG